MLSIASWRTTFSTQPPPTHPNITLASASISALEPGLAELEPSISTTVAIANGAPRDLNSLRVENISWYIFSGFSAGFNQLVHRVISRRLTAVGQLADFQGGPSRTGSNDPHI